LSSLQANKWQQVFNLEYDSLVKNWIWTLVDLSSNWSTINCKWVLRKAYNVDGPIVWLKARLMAHGFFKVEKIDYQELFSPLIKKTYYKSFFLWLQI
jgi:hypothetical protein